MRKHQDIQKKTVYVSKESLGSPLRHLVLVADTMPWHQAGERFLLKAKPSKPGRATRQEGILVIRHTSYWNELLAAPEAAARAAFTLQKAALDVEADQLAEVGPDSLPKGEPTLEWGIVTTRMLVCSWADYKHDWGPAERYVRERVGDLEARRLVPDHGTGEPLFVMPLSNLTEALLRLADDNSA